MEKCDWWRMSSDARVLRPPVPLMWLEDVLLITSFALTRRFPHRRLGTSINVALVGPGSGCPDIVGLKNGEVKISDLVSVNVLQCYVALRNTM